MQRDGMWRDSLSQNMFGFEEEEAQREKEDRTVCDCTKEQFPQGGPNFPAGAASNALRSLSRREEIAGKKTGSDDKKNFDGYTPYQFLGWCYDDPSEREPEKNIREDCQVRHPVGWDLSSHE